MHWIRVFCAVLLWTYGASQRECQNETSCRTKENGTSTDIFEPIEESGTETPSTELPTTITETSTKPTSTSTTSKSPTTKFSLTPADTSQSSKICWCDRHVHECDINCCCDKECSIIQQQVFTSCSNLQPRQDPNSCYSSNLFFRQPKAKEGGLFCVVRENLHTKREFKARAPIQTLEEFEKLVRRRKNLQYTRHNVIEPEFKVEPYKGGSPVWTVERGKLAPLHVLSSLFGDLCLTSTPVYYLKEIMKTCTLRLPRQEPLCSQAISQILRKLNDVKIISSPIKINTSDTENSLQSCLNLDACISIKLHQCSSQSKCIVMEKISNFGHSFNCKKFGLEVILHIMHNGTEGIQEVNAYLRPLNSTQLETQVKFIWSNTETGGFIRSGNPGYITGRPVLAGRKVMMTSNDTTTQGKEVIELTLNPTGWLTVFGSDRGQCSPKNRRWVAFNENIKHSCFFPLEKLQFSKNGCVEMQRNILKILLEEDFSNLTSDSFNKYLGIFGNSKVGSISEWLQVMIENYSLISTLSSFENSTMGLICKGIITEFFIDIAVAKFGSFINPQNKIVGALIRFGVPNDVFDCTSRPCNFETKRRRLKLMTEINYLDITRPAVREFAKPPGLEAKLPHDFFYPFFSGKGSKQNFNYLLPLLSNAVYFCCLS